MAPFVFTIIILILGMKAPPFRDGDEMPPSAVNRRQSPSSAPADPKEPLVDRRAVWYGRPRNRLWKGSGKKGSGKASERAEES